MSELLTQLKKYNFWDGAPPKTGIKRTAYLDRLEHYLGNSLIKVLIGQRRAGKSYLLRQIIALLMEREVVPANIFYLNKELVEFDSIRTHQDLHTLLHEYKQATGVRGKIYIFLDEVQDIEGWEKIVNSLAQNHKEEYEIFLSGSNSSMLSGELATLLSGRFVAIEVLPFSYSEFCVAYQRPSGKDSYLAFLKSGGLPELSHLNNDEVRRQYVAGVRDTILLKDIVARFSIKDAALLQDIFSFCTDAVGNLLSVNNIVHFMNSHNRKTNHETVSNYLRFLADAFLLHETARYDVRGKSLLARQRKYYLNDTAFRSFLSSGFDPAPGKLLENAVYLHYRSLGYQIFVGMVGTQEVDFVVEKNGDRQYVQVCYMLADEKVIDREFGVLEKIEDNYPKIVVSLDDISFGVRNGIRHVRPWEL